MRSTRVQKSPKTWPTSGEVNDQFWFCFDGLVGETGRIDVDFVDIGNK